MVLPFAAAWGIAYANNHLTVEQGQKREVNFTLQNYVGNELKRIIVELNGDKEIATILNKKDYYLLPPKTKDSHVIIQIAVPKPAKKNYRVNVNFIAFTGSGGISLSNVKVIPLYIDVPDGTLSNTDVALQEQADIPVNLTKTYQEIEEKIEKTEGRISTKIQGLTVLGKKNNALPIILAIVGFLALSILISHYRQKKRQEKWGLR